MDLFHLPQVEPACLRIREAARRGTLSHALLFTGSGRREEAARYAAAALECSAPGAKPCGVCEGCRKVRENIHPDVITVRDSAHKNLSVEMIREVRSDAYIRPNEGARKVYLFPDCALLTEQDQNVLLKIVEEGPPYAAFLFCAENGAAVLQTLRSRCVECRLRPDQSEESDGRQETAEQLCRLLASGRRGSITELTVQLERKRLSREDLSGMLERCRSQVAAALLLRYGKRPEPEEQALAELLARRLTNTQLMRTIEVLQTYRADCTYYVGANHVLGALAVELEAIL